MAIFGAPMRMQIDAYDQAILDLMQTDCTLSHATIGERVGLSGSAVRRRISTLRKTGVISQEVAIVNAESRIAGITVIVTVAFAQETQASVDAFRAAMRREPNVMQCYATAGQFDFILVVAAESPAHYEEWGERTLMSNSMLKRYDSFVVWSTVKFTTKRPQFSR